ncbi:MULTISPECIES: mevalonate kinase [unclassified Nocardia]|uniref:mevalonate kinase n=1 Tax=unclassified Nocardia TaxID=2637762 RepID=UPI001CE3E937|nr:MULTISPECIES: mevalonate kinase [unclassified Nocardia]
MNSNGVRESGHPVAGVGAGGAHGKAILLGEHTVVHGTPAIAFPLPTLAVRAAARVSDPGEVPTVDIGTSPAGWCFRFVAGNAPAAAQTLSGPQVAVGEALRRWGIGDETVEVTVDCAIPPARGLGSSAACAGAAVRAVADLHGRTLDAASLYELVQCGEQFAHGKASGVDASTVLANAPIWFHAGATRALEIGLDAELVLADTGTSGATQRAVAAVRRRLDGDRLAAQRLLERAADLTWAAAADLAAGRAASLGKALREFQCILGELGVSTPEIDTLVAAAHAAGSLGAKLTGGGLGGCVIALAETGDAARVSEALRRAGAVRTWLVPTRAVRP